MASRERDEEGVALRVDLVAVVGRHGVADDPVVLREHRGVTVAESLKEAGRALDVGEQQRDGACGQVRHRPWLRLPAPGVKLASGAPAELADRALDLSLDVERLQALAQPAR